MESSQSGKQAFVKLLAIVGFFATVGLIVWLLIQGIRMFPTTFSSLASIAETIDGYRPKSEVLSIDTGKSIVNSGEQFTINWTDMGKGSYTFTHACIPEVLVAVRTDGGELQDIPCTESLTLPEGVQGLFLSATSKAQRFSDVPFSITFDSESGDEYSAQSSVTVVNASVPTKTETVAVRESETVSIPKIISLPPEESVVPEPEIPLAVTEPEVTEGIVPSTLPIVDAPTVMPPALVLAPTSTPVAETTLPTSTPVVAVVEPIVPITTPEPVREPAPTHIAAPIVAFLPPPFTDLQTTYLGVGTIRNGSFVPKATFDQDDTAAFRFEVKNIGTKTSGAWMYRLTLPGDVEYTSELQIGLTLNEKVVFTVGFNLGTNPKATVQIGGVVAASGDVNPGNNNFNWSVNVSR